MTSQKQTDANRRNALLSTGPRSEEGKQKSRQNALKHGLTAETVIVGTEDAAAYVAFVDQPADCTEASGWTKIGQGLVE